MWVKLNESSFTPLDVVKLSSNDYTKTTSPILVDESFIEKLNSDAHLEKGRYYFFSADKYIAFQKTSTLFPWVTKKRRIIFEYKSKYIVERFRISAREKLLDNCFGPQKNIKVTLKAIRDYTFCQHFSFWVYNPHTESFLLHSSSFSSEQEVISAHDPNSSLSEMLAPESHQVSREVNDGLINSTALSEMRTVSRFTITAFDVTGSFEVQGVLSLYSEHEGFIIRDETKLFLSEIVSLKLSRSLSPYITSYNTLLRDLSEKYKPGQLYDFLEKFVDNLRNTLRYESASIFLVDDGDRTLLKLRAVSEYENVNIPDPVPCYDTRQDSLTAKVYNNNNLQYSYKIKDDHRNTHIFDERTEHKSKNWIGVPISGSGEIVFGVLRTKNRIEHGEIVPFNKIDIDVLKDVSSVISYLCSIEAAFVRHKKDSETLLKNQQRENQELNEYLKTYRHEIKSPLIVVTQGANALKRALANENLIKGDKIPKKVAEVLDDLDMVGNRLVFVTNVLTFDAHDIVKDFADAFIFKEIVAPILSFATHYAKNRKKFIDVDKDSLFLPKVYCDANASSMAFHVVIDNAIKYASKGNTINIYGIKKQNTCSIIVESFGLPVLEEEKNYIFKKFSRGHHAKVQKTEGSGIGLYLGKQIMQLNNGSLKLTKLANPTTFEIEFKKSWS